MVYAKGDDLFGWRIYDEDDEELYEFRDKEDMLDKLDELELADDSTQLA